MLAKKYQRLASAKKNLIDVGHKNPNQRWPKITLPKIDQKHPWSMSTENALTNANWKIVLVDVGLKMPGPMLTKIVLVEVGQKYHNQDQTFTYCSLVSMFKYLKKDNQMI